MLKISNTLTANGVVALKLEGWISGPWVEELRTFCEGFLDEHLTLKLDLADVSFVDRNGAAVISSLKSRGVSLENCPSFIEEQLKNG